MLKSTAANYKCFFEVSEMIYKICTVVLLYAIFSVKANLHKPNSFHDSSKCQYANGLTEGNRTTELECCNTTVRNYYDKSKPYEEYLTTFLESLQIWNCPEFQQECERRTFNYTEFTSLIYLRFCNRSQMEAQCYDHIQRIVKKQNNENQITTSEFSRLVSKLNLTILSEEDLRNPCTQVAMYDSGSGRQGHYHEIIEPAVPFCSFVWCGFDKNISIKKHITPWTCMHRRCWRRLILYLVANSFLGLAIVICNATVLGVLFLKKQNAQSIYRQSLAVADIIMGILVIPIRIGTLYQHYVRNQPNADLRKVESNAHAIGFFCMLSLSVSVLSIVAASYDRLVAIFRPLRYNNLKAIFAAKITVVSVWFAGFVLAVLPIAFPRLGYDFVIVYGKFSSGGRLMLAVYAIVYFFTIVLMWFSNIATYVAARPSLRSHEQQHKTGDEIRVLGTLGIMSAVFTLCVLPMAIILMIKVFMPQVDFSNPINFDAVASAQLKHAELGFCLVLTSNGVWNCFIYSIRETTFRRATKLLYKRIAQCLKLDQACIWFHERRN